MMIMTTAGRILRIILQAVLREGAEAPPAAAHPAAITETVINPNGNWITKNAAIKRDMSPQNAIRLKTRSTSALMTILILKNVSVNRDWSPVQNLITVWAKAAAVNMLPVSWTTPEPAARTAIRKPEAATRFKTLTDAARTTLITLINASAGRIYIPVLRRYRVSAPPAAENTPTASARARIAPVPVEKLPALHPALGAAQPNIRPANPVIPLQVLPVLLRVVQAEGLTALVLVLLMVNGKTGIILGGESGLVLLGKVEI